jgi:hypothetical protein
MASFLLASVKNHIHLGITHSIPSKTRQLTYCLVLSQSPTQHTFSRWQRVESLRPPSITAPSCGWMCCCTGLKLTVPRIHGVAEWCRDVLLGSLLLDSFLTDMPSFSQEMNAMHSHQGHFSFLLSRNEPFHLLSVTFADLIMLPFLY